MRIVKRTLPAELSPTRVAVDLARDLEATVRRVRWNDAPGVMHQAVFDTLKGAPAANGIHARAGVLNALVQIAPSCNRPAQAAEALSCLTQLPGAPLDTGEWVEARLYDLFSAVPLGISTPLERLTLELATLVRAGVDDLLHDGVAEHFFLPEATPADRKRALGIAWNGTLRLLEQVSGMPEKDAAASLFRIQRQIAQYRVSLLGAEFRRGPETLAQERKGLEPFLQEGVFSGLPGDVASRTEAARSSASLLATLEGLQPATPQQYEAWLARYIQAGNRPTHFYDEDFAGRFHAYAGQRVSLPVPMHGAAGLSILVPRPGTPIHVLRGLGHTQVYAYDAAGKAVCHHDGFPFVPVYGDAGLGFKHLVPPDRQLSGVRLDDRRRRCW